MVERICGNLGDGVELCVEKSGSFLAVEVQSGNDKVLVTQLLANQRMSCIPDKSFNLFKDGGNWVVRIGKQFQRTVLGECEATEASKVIISNKDIKKGVTALKQKQLSAQEEKKRHEGDMAGFVKSFDFTSVGEKAVWDHEPTLLERGISTYCYGAYVPKRQTRKDALGRDIQVFDEEKEKAAGAKIRDCENGLKRYRCELNDRLIKSRPGYEGSQTHQVMRQKCRTNHSSWR